MKLSFTQWLSGVCRFDADGDFPERFLNLAARADLGLWDIHRKNGKINAYIIASRYRLLRPMARKCGLRLRITEKHGLPFMLLPYRNRVGMPLGFLIFCGLIWFLSLFVWFIDMPVVSDEVQPKLEQAVYDCGLRQGVQRSSLDGARLGEELMQSVDELSWAGVSIIGSHVVVDVRELEKIAPPVDKSQPCNIVADESGVIVSVTAEDGEILVIREQTVARGDLLISGVVELSNGSIELVHSRGEVLARVDHQLTCEIPFAQRNIERTGRVVVLRRLMLLGIEVPLYGSKLPEGQFERESSEWYLTAGKEKLPLCVRTEYWYEQKPVNRIISAEEATALALADIEAQLDAIDCLEVLSFSQRIDEDDDCVRVSANVTTLEDIALDSAILVG